MNCLAPSSSKDLLKHFVGPAWMTKEAKTVARVHHIMTRVLTRCKVTCPKSEKRRKSKDKWEAVLRVDFIMNARLPDTSGARMQQAKASQRCQGDQAVGELPSPQLALEKKFWFEVNRTSQNQLS